MWNRDGMDPDLVAATESLRVLARSCADLATRVEQGDDPLEVITELSTAYFAAYPIVHSLLPADDSPAAEEPAGPVVSVRTRTDYNLNDVGSVLAATGEPNLADAMYAALHDSTDDRLLALPGLEPRWGAVSVHVSSSSSTLDEIIEQSPTELMTMPADAEELRGIIDIWGA
jgi:hypothetical protein